MSVMPLENSTDISPIFTFEVVFDVSDPLITFDDCASLRGQFRHFGAEPIDLMPGVAGAFNLGLKLYTKGKKNIPIFEDRMLSECSSIKPNIWVGVTVKIPRSVIRFEDEFVVVVDMLKEEEYWFSEAGEKSSCAFDVRFLDGVQGTSDASLPNGNSVRTAPNILVAEPVNLLPLPASDSAGIVHLVFDISDLIQYFRHARLPTGIQRVQIEVITNLVFAHSESYTLKIGCFTKETDTWLELPPLFFNHIAKLALISGDPEAADWLRVLEELRLHLEQAKPLIFSRGAYLINLGTSWWLQNYFLHVRAAKAKYGIRYIPYVHDCIPIMTPEHCVEGLTRDFITWAMGAFQHADHIMVNSNATAKDVRLVAGMLGHSIDEPRVVTLDADYRAANERLPPELGTAANAEIFLKNDIRVGDYALFVSTVESRKNHFMAFSVWLTLVKKHGIGNVPKLVCVGNRGWLNDAIYAKLSASKILQKKIVMLSRISDPDLELLYRNCLFTLYPSAYEGWGLPVTESLCFGKVPVLANGSSLPEAGGEFGEYFELGSENAMLQALEKMIFDHAYRESREALVRERFHARSWGEIAQNVVGLVQQWSATDAPADAGREIFGAKGLWPFPVELGRYYGLTENRETQIIPGMMAGEMFRQGDGWWWTEPWGCWTKPKIAKLAFLTPLKPKNDAVLYVRIRGVQGLACTAIVALEGVARRTVNLEPEQFQWLIFRVSKSVLQTLPKSKEGVLFELQFSANAAADFRPGTGGADHRVASVGVCGFMACAADDVMSRMSFVENMALGDFEGLMCY